MNDLTPNMRDWRTALEAFLKQQQVVDIPKHMADFDRVLAEQVRVSKGEAWDELAHKIRDIPHWWDTETHTGGFDVDGNEFAAVHAVIRDNPYRSSRD